MDNKELRRHPPSDRQRVRRLLGAPVQDTRQIDETGNVLSMIRSQGFRK
jgi:hypothetical protein